MSSYSIGPPDLYTLKVPIKNVCMQEEASLLLVHAVNPQLCHKQKVLNWQCDSTQAYA